MRELHSWRIRVKYDQKEFISLTLFLGFSKATKQGSQLRLEFQASCGMSAIYSNPFPPQPELL